MMLRQESIKHFSHWINKVAARFIAEIFLVAIKFEKLLWGIFRIKFWEGKHLHLQTSSQKCTGIAGNQSSWEFV